MISAIVLFYMFIPIEYLNHLFENFYTTYFNYDPPVWIDLVLNTVYFLSVAAVSPFYVGAGFAAYLNRRTQLEAWDIETTQAKVDMIIASLNTEKLEKEKAEWMKSEVYAKNVDKVVFAAQWYHLQKQGYPDKVGVNGADFKTELDMAGNMNFMAFFSVPPSVKYPGQQINIEYEMNGKKTNRETLRKKSAAWSNMVPVIESKKFEYRQSPTRAIREYNQYQSAFVQDYAAIQLLYDNKDKLKVGQTYDFTVRIYSHRDGENGAVIAEGTVKLKYTDKAKIAFEGDPEKPELKGVFGQFEAFLNE